MSLALGFQCSLPPVVPEVRRSDQLEENHSLLQVSCLCPPYSEEIKSFFVLTWGSPRSEVWECVEFGFSVSASRAGQLALGETVV